MVKHNSISEPPVGKAKQTGLLLLSDNGDAFAARVLSARSAVRSLDLMYYLWHDDHTGQILLSEVLDAADRGVKVRLLLDDINPRANDALYRMFVGHPNVSLRLFNPSKTRESRWRRAIEIAANAVAMTRRMHNKAWIADDKFAIIGGRNIGDAYFDAADTNFRDLDVLMFGEAVKQTSTIFEAFWSSPSSKPMEQLNRARSRRRMVSSGAAATEAHTEHLERLRGRVSVADFIAGCDTVHWIGDARVISDPPDKVVGRKRRNWLMRTLLPVIESSREKVEIVSPYFIPGRRGSAILERLRSRGVAVSVLTNSLAATDVAAVHGAYMNYRRRVLRAGVELFELQPYGGGSKISMFGSKGASLHTKAFTVDGRAGFVGTFNFDPRSVSLNTEMGLLFEDPALVAELRRRFSLETAPQSSYSVRLESGALSWTGEVDGEMRRYGSEPEASLFRRCIALLVRRLPIESQL